jgi:hypothetical protein
MYIIFGGNIYQEHLGAHSIICFVERRNENKDIKHIDKDREYAIEIASKFIYEGLTKEESWCQVYDLNDKMIIWENNEINKEINKNRTELFKKNYKYLNNDTLNININN